MVEIGLRIETNSNAFGMFSVKVSKVRLITVIAQIFLDSFPENSIKFNSQWILGRKMHRMSHLPDKGFLLLEIRLPFQNALVTAAQSGSSSLKV